jgi:hypothetical protein
VFENALWKLVNESNRIGNYFVELHAKNAELQSMLDLSKLVSSHRSTIQRTGYFIVFNFALCWNNIIDKWLMKGQLDLCDLRFGLVDFVVLPIDWRNLLSLSLCFGNIALKIVCFVVFVDKRLSCFALFLAGLKTLSTIASALIACVSLETVSVYFQDQTLTVDSLVFLF